MKLPRFVWAGLGMSAVVLFAKGITFAAGLVLRAI